MDNEAVYTFHIDMTREKAWKKLRDFTLAPNYVPNVESVEITTDKTEGVGASRHVSPTNIDETIVEWQDGKGFTMRLHKGEGGPPFPFKDAGFQYKIEEDGSRTICSVALIYNMMFGTVGNILNSLILNRIINGIVRDIGLSLKYFYETGDPVTPKILKQIKAKN